MHKVLSFNSNQIISGRRKKLNYKTPNEIYLKECVATIS